MKKLKIIILMIIILLVSISLSGEEIKIIKNNDPDIKQVEMNGLPFFLVTPLFMNQVEIVDSENEINKSIIDYYIEMEDLFKKSISLVDKQQIQVRILAITTSIGFSLVLGLTVGILVFALLDYYSHRNGYS